MCYAVIKGRKQNRNIDMGGEKIMTLRTYIDRAIHDGADFDAVISGCDVQQTFCW